MHVPVALSLQLYLQIRITYQERLIHGPDPPMLILVVSVLPEPVLRLQEHLSTLSILFRAQHLQLLHRQMVVHQQQQQQLYKLIQLPLSLTRMLRFAAELHLRFLLLMGQALLYRPVQSIHGRLLWLQEV